MIAVQAEEPKPQPVRYVDAADLTLPDGVTPTKNVFEPAPVDVLCGRGGGTNHHPGNNHWRALVTANKRLYISLPKRRKGLVAKSIVHAIRSQVNPHGGRFLQRDEGKGCWHDIGDRKATEKTSQALREGAPEIRSEMEQEGRREGESEYGKPGDGPGPHPGQILPNGLVALDYEGVRAVLWGGRGGGPHADGTVDAGWAPPTAAAAQAVVGEAQQRAMDPMMRAFQEFLGRQMGAESAQGQGEAAAAAAAEQTQDPKGQQQQQLQQQQSQLHNAPLCGEAVVDDKACPAAAAANAATAGAATLSFVEQLQGQLAKNQAAAAAPAQQTLQQTLQGLGCIPALRNRTSIAGSVATVERLQEHLARSKAASSAPVPQMAQQAPQGLACMPTLWNGTSIAGPVAAGAVVDAGAIGASGRATAPAAVGKTAGVPPSIAAMTVAPSAAAGVAAGGAGGVPRGAASAPVTAPAPQTQTMTREMAYKILLREKAQKAQKMRQGAGEGEGAVGTGWTAGQAAAAAGAAGATASAAAAGAARGIAGARGLPRGYLQSALAGTGLAVGLGGAAGGPAGGTAGIAMAGTITAHGGAGMHVLPQGYLQSALAGTGGPMGAGGLSAAGIPGGLGGMTAAVGGGGLASPLHSRQFLVDYAASTAGGTTSLAQQPQALPTLPGNISSMTDEQIRDALQRLESLRPASGGAGHSAMTSSLRRGASADLSLGGGVPADHHLAGDPRFAGLAGGGLGRLSDLRGGNPYAANLLQSALSPAAVRSESLGADRALFDALLGFDPPGLEAGESLGPTPLRPGLSATLARARGVAAAGAGGVGASVPSTVALPAQAHPQTSLQEYLLMQQAEAARGLGETAAPRRGVSGASLDDLCLAAGVHAGDRRGSSIGGSERSLTGAASGGTSLSQKMKMFRGLMDAKGAQPDSPDRMIEIKRWRSSGGDQQRQQALRPPSPLGTSAAQEWDNVKKASDGRKAALKPGRNDHSLLDDSDQEEEDDDRPIISLSKKRATSGNGGRPTKKRTRNATATGTNQPSKQPVARDPEGRGSGVPSGAVNLQPGVSFSRNISRALPTETVLDHGHSLAMSEISLDRGHSFAGGGVGAAAAAGGNAVGKGQFDDADEGQFDDASEDEGEDEGGKAAMARGMTLGTIHTFPLSKG
ncbi:hypothetical protein ACHAWF_014385 [Thalassiosira exigua]